MKKGILLLFIGALMTQCATVPITGRKQVKLLPSSQLNSMSLDQYSQVKKTENLLPDSDPRVIQIREIGNNIANAVTKFMNANHMKDQLKEFSWEFNVADQDILNAWCMPGGRVMFYTGILPVCDGVGGIATVMGHEVAHAVARHGNERMSQGLVTQLGGAALSVALSEKPQETQNLFLAAYGASSQLGMLKYSRTHETEADKMGLVFMIMAGYDPEESIEFWGRMAAQKGGAAPPEFLSTHPSDQTRINDLKNFIPEARQLAAKYQ